MGKFVILSPARSGSTALRTTLANHKEICCHGEILGRNRIIGYFPCKGKGPELPRNGDVRLKGTNDFLDKYVFFIPGNVRAVGFKLLYYQVGEVKFAEAVERLANDDDIGFIHLWRRDLVRRCISDEIHTRTVSGEIGSFTLSEECVAQDCRNQIALRDRMKSIFGEKDILEVEYEALLKRPRDVLDEVCGFLGATPGALERLSSPPESEHWNPLTAPTAHLNWAGRTGMNIRKVLYIAHRSAAILKAMVKGSQDPIVSNANALLTSPRLEQYRDVPLADC